jgi:hypothetical protein
VRESSEDGTIPLSRRATLRVLRDGRLVRQMRLTRGRVVIGRNEEADLRLDHPTVSRSHAELVCGPFGQWWIHDLGSRNGTHIAGDRVDERMLQPGDRVQIGDFTLELVRRPSVTDMRALTDSQPTLTQHELLDVQRTAPQAAAAAVTPKHLRTINLVSAELHAIEDATQRLERLCRAMIDDDLPADAVVALRLTSDEAAEVLSGPYRRFGPDGDGPYFSRAVFRELLETRRSVVASNLTAELPDTRELSLPTSVRPLAVLACPLDVGDGHMDVLYAEFPWRYATPSWGAIVELMVDSYLQADMVWQMRQDLRVATRVEHQLETARELQTRLLPDCASIAELDVGVGYEPSQWVGGDYVDAVYMPDGRVLLAVADVCGKGLGASLVSSSIHTMVRSNLGRTRSALELIEKLNEYLCAHLPDSAFVTMVVVVIDPGSGEMECVNAGHPAPMVVSESGERRWLQSECNIALGIMPTEFVTQHSRLGRDDVLVAYTDGVFERHGTSSEVLDAEELAQRLATELRERPHARAEELVRWLTAALAEPAGSQLKVDDTTFLVVRHQPSASDV